MPAVAGHPHLRNAGSGPGRTRAVCWEHGASSARPPRLRAEVTPRKWDSPVELVTDVTATGLDILLLREIQDVLQGTCVPGPLGYPHVFQTLPLRPCGRSCSVQPRLSVSLCLPTPSLSASVPPIPQSLFLSLCPPHSLCPSVPLGFRPGLSVCLPCSLSLART